jgi:hypothetical protein
LGFYAYGKDTGVTRRIKINVADLQPGPDTPPRPRRPTTVTQAAVQRAIRAAKKEGLDVREVVIDGSQIRVIAGKPTEQAIDEWDGAKPT